jgi:LmbE family N-acetylglucosaminyl deacetylase
LRVQTAIMRFFLFVTFLHSATLFAQSHQPDASQIKLKLKKLNYLGSVLYVAAHPDDENTRVIAYLANERLAATAYLSMTRGDGGQNLIGPEIRDLLGLIRTQELLAARRIDGGQQFFTRANDFGFSKNAKETFEIWNKQEILSDVVKVFRVFEPDVIITRFPPDERAGHGHHTASAILAQEAFDLSGDEKQFPDQAKEFGIWKPMRLFTNTGRWWNQTINENTPGVVSLDVGLYNSLLGKSYSEIAAESRTQHKSQGFGSPGRRGSALDFFEFVKGEKAEKDIFDQINTTWSRLKGGEKVQLLVEQAIHSFNPEKPHLSIPQLLLIRKQINSLSPSVWKERKLKETEQLIRDCLGLFVEVTADQFWVAPGEKIQASFELVNRANYAVTLKSIKSEALQMDSSLVAELKDNNLLLFKSRKVLNSSLGYSDPYWLREEHSQGLFKVPNKQMIGQAENSPAVSIQFDFLIENEALQVNVPLVYKWTDPVKGEQSRPFEIVPPLFVNLSEKVIVFPDQKPRSIELLIKSSSYEVQKGILKLELPDGWKSEPADAPFELSKKGQEKSLHFLITPSKEELNTSLKAVAEVNGKKMEWSVQTIQYDHIPTQTLLPKAQAKLVRMDLRKEGGLIGYINGAGDDVPSALRYMGYEVWEMKNEEIIPSNLKKLDAVVLGVRALNTNERVSYFMPDLFEYVKNGGTMVVQYNTNSDLELDKDKIAPYPLQLSRDRVTQENGEVRILKPDHALLNYPNKITAQDFNGWVQERGLYFPDKWDSNFEAILSMNDSGEPARDGSLLIAKYGEGNYIYTGLSFFRELPEGVSGAYKLFANLVSQQNKLKKPSGQKVKSSR